MDAHMEQFSNSQKARNLELRTAVPADAGILTALVVAAFQEYRGTVLPPSGAHQETAESIGRRLASGRATIAVVGGVDAGCVFSESHADGYVYFSRLCVLPQFRNRGVGAALIECVELEARASGARGVRLGVRLQLEALIGRYERLGYRIARLLTHDNYAEPTYVYMEKRIG
jgi:ribosomal protein S18 acetylase RimI-like enzyme